MSDRRPRGAIVVCWCAVFATLRLALAASGSPILRWQPLYEPGSGGWIASIAVSPHDAKRVLAGGDVLGAGLSEDGGETWQATFGFSSWEIADFTYHPVDPRVVWAGTMSGPFASEDGGQTWRARREGFPPVSAWSYSAPIQKVLFDPNNPSRLIAVGGSRRRAKSPGKPLWGAVWESRDAGGHWKQIATLAGGSNILAAAFAAGSSDTLYAAVEGLGVQVSRDGGKTWVARNSGLPHTDVNGLAVHPTLKRTLWVALDGHRAPGGETFDPGGVYKSTDGGATWSPAQEGLPRRRGNDPRMVSRYADVAVAPAAPGVLLTADADWREAAVYRSTDGGASWRPVLTRENVATAYASGPSMNVLEFDPKDPRAAYAGSSESVLRTLDGGGSWVDVTSYRPRGAAGWRGRGFSGLVGTGFKFDPLDPHHAVLLAMDRGNFWQSRDDLRSWTRGGEGIPGCCGGRDVAFSGEGGRVMYVTLGQAGSFDGIAKTTDRGESWRVLRGNGLPPANPGGGGDIYALPDRPDEVWAVLAGSLYRSIDGGEHWRVAHGGPGLRSIAAVPGRPRTFYVSGARGGYRTDDGETFDLVPGSPTDAQRLAVAGSEPTCLFVIARGELWRLLNGSWTGFRHDPQMAGLAADPSDPDRIAIATDDEPYHDVSRASGVWITEDGGKTWTQENQGLPCLRGSVLAFNPHDPEQLIFGTDGRGFFVTRWPRRAR